MKAAHLPVQRHRDARLLIVDACGRVREAPRGHLPRALRPGDLLVANDAATLPASLRGLHDATGREIEVRLAGRTSLDVDAVREFTAIVSGTHEPGTSHYELLRAFAGDAVLRRASRVLDERGFRTHEFGDSVLIGAACE